MTNGSKKAAMAILGLVAVFGFIHTYNVYAADSTGGSLLDALGGGNTSWSSSITSTGATSTGATLTFPVFTSNGESIMNYAVSYVKGKSIATAELTDIKKATFAGDKVKVENNQVSIVLDGLDAGATYNYVVTPINKEGTELTPSDEQTFTTTSSNTTNTTATTTSVDAAFGAADTTQANFTYTVSGSKVTVTWKAIAGVSKFMISMKEANDTSYSNVGSEMVSKETYSFIIGKKGLYTVKIVPVDGKGATVGAEKVLSVKIEKTTPLDGKGKPATGAGLNLILMSTFLLMLVYVVYRFRTTK